MTQQQSRQERADSTSAPPRCAAPRTDDDRGGSARGGPGRGDVEPAELVPQAELVPHAEQVLRALGSATRSSPPQELADRLSVAAATSTGSQGASLCALFTPEMSVPIGVSGDQAALAEKIQFSTRQGPCWEAFATGRAVRLHDVARTAPGASGDGSGRWPAYAAELLRTTGFRAVVAVPVRLASGLRVVLNLLSEDPDPASHRMDLDALAAGLVRLLDQASPSPQQGGAAWLDSSSSLRRAAVWLAESHLMAVRAGLSSQGALLLLREYADDAASAVDDVAADLVSGRLAVARVLMRS